MKNETARKDTEETREEPVQLPKEDSTQETEFKVTVRKLEVPVRPRGVLAE
jgi:hypothetical protein